MSDKHDLLNDNDMCSFSGHEAEEMCFNCGDHTCGERRINYEKREVENCWKWLKMGVCGS